MTEEADVFQSFWTNVHGLKIHSRRTRHARAGALTPVILVHGFGVSSRYMVPTAHSLAPFVPVFALDFPGSGHSEAPVHSLSIAELADFLADWMTEIGVDRATLLGNSFGCQIIAAFVLRHPNRIARAVLVGPTVDPANSDTWRLLRQLGRDLFHERPSEVLISMRDYWRFGLRRAGSTFLMMKEDRIEMKLPHMKLPTLVVRGGKDSIVSQHWVETAVALLPAGALVVIPGSAHAVNYDAPDALVAAVVPFLQLDR